MQKGFNNLYMRFQACGLLFGNPFGKEYTLGFEQRGQLEKIRPTTCYLSRQNKV